MVARPKPEISAFLVALALCLFPASSQADNLDGYLPPEAEVVNLLELKSLNPP